MESFATVGIAIVLKIAQLPLMIVYGLKPMVHVDTVKRHYTRVDVVILQDA